MRRTALAVVHRAGLAVTPPLLFGSGEEDLIELCSETKLDSADSTFKG